MAIATLSAAAVSSTSGDLTLVVHRGDRAVLLAMDLPAARTDRLAGFALSRTPPGGTATDIVNRLSFATPITAATTPAQRRWFPSSEAPFQKFRWVDVPSEFLVGDYTYTATAMYFDASGALTAGDRASVSIDISRPPAPHLTIGFTRAFMSSQAYAQRYHNAPFHPAAPSIDFDTAPYEDQYAWLGFHARELIGSFLADCIADASVSVDMFAYDLNDPDTIKAMVALGSRLRLYLDDASLHRDSGSAPNVKHVLETDAAAAVIAAGGAVERGHFARFAHSKVLIAKRHGHPFRVLTGSANFSLRGLFVQANNVLVFESPVVASWYEEAFTQAWTSPSTFASAPIAQGWHELSGAGLPAGAIAFSPHTSSAISLDRLSATIGNAQSSLLFSVMGLDGGGPVLAQLRAGMQKPGMFNYGVTQASSYMQLYKPGATRAVRVPFAYLHANVPPPFQAEISGGVGQVIHDKFVVVDFNGADPRVYTGSSNLAAGGEEQNGDNLIELRGSQVATMYMVDAVKQIDHFHFRAAKQAATGANPLVLVGADHWQDWVNPYYDPNDLKSLDRQLFSRVPPG